MRNTAGGRVSSPPKIKMKMVNAVPIIFSPQMIFDRSSIFDFKLSHYNNHEYDLLKDTNPFQPFINLVDNKAIPKLYKLTA